VISPSPLGGRRRTHLVAAALYLAVASFALRAALVEPGEVLPYAAELDRYEVPFNEHNDYRFATTEIQDQQFVVSVFTQHARSLWKAPWSLFDLPQCYPLQRSLTLGEHMLGTGLLAAVPYALTGDPILTYDAIAILALWLPAMAMYALVFHWTGSGMAAFVSGFLFAFHPDRVFYPSHPFVHGNQWTPLALLFADRLFSRRSWWDACGLALFLGLQILESPYQLIPLVIVGGFYGAYLLVRYRSELCEVAPKLAAVGAVVVAVSGAVFGPYLAARATWPGLLRTQDASFPLSLLDPGELGLGGGAYAGSVALVLALLGLVDRFVRHRRDRGYDPRLVFLIGGSVVAWCIVSAIRIPLLDVSVPSPLVVARDLVPGLAAMRVPVHARLGYYLVTAFLAGYGVLWLIEGRARTTQFVVGGVLVASAFVESFYAPVTDFSFRHPVDMTTHRARPDPAVIDLYRRAPAGPVLDVPFSGQAAAEYVSLQSHHHRPVAACYNSFFSPLKAQITALAANLPLPSAADALAALGFGSVFVHTNLLPPSASQELRRKIAKDPQVRERLTRIDAAGDVVAYRLASPVPVSSDFELLAVRGRRQRSITVTRPRARIAFVLRNRGKETFRQPDPLAPDDLIVRWLDDAGKPAGESRERALLPIALAPGARFDLGLDVSTPERGGRYVVELARAAQPATILARWNVDVDTKAEDTSAETSRSVTPPGGTETEMVRIPGGSFAIGCRSSVDSGCEADEAPRTVELAEFWIDETETTVAQFARCVSAGACPGEGSSCSWRMQGLPDHPVSCVTFEQASAYCAWKGRRLPSEAEWEAAARGVDGRKYPWGNAELAVAGAVANVFGRGPGGTSVVGSYPGGASPYGALDMIGNVWEWTADSTGADGVVRGASWYSLPKDVRVSNRYLLERDRADNLVGFRCAR